MRVVKKGDGAPRRVEKDEGVSMHAYEVVDTDDGSTGLALVVKANGRTYIYAFKDKLAVYTFCSAVIAAAEECRWDRSPEGQAS